MIVKEYGFIFLRYHLNERYNTEISKDQMNAREFFLHVFLYKKHSGIWLSTTVSFSLSFWYSNFLNIS